MSTVTVPRDNLVFQRFLAMFLFAGGFVFAVGTIAAASKMAFGDMRSIGMLVGTGLPTWMLVWLSMVLWSGRGIPRWYIASFLLLTALGPMIMAFLCNTWTETLTLLGAAIPMAFAVQPTVRSYLGKPAKPKTIDEI